MLETQVLVLHDKVLVIVLVLETQVLVLVHDKVVVLVFVLEA